jgi:hypothetical protein
MAANLGFDPYSKDNVDAYWETFKDWANPGDKPNFNGLMARTLLPEWQEKLLKEIDERAANICIQKEVCSSDKTAQIKEIGRSSLQPTWATSGFAEGTWFSVLDDE